MSLLFVYNLRGWMYACKLGIIALCKFPDSLIINGLNSSVPFKIVPLSLQSRNKKEAGKMCGSSEGIRYMALWDKELYFKM